MRAGGKKRECHCNKRQPAIVDAVGGHQARPCPNDTYSAAEGARLIDWSRRAAYAPRVPASRITAPVKRAAFLVCLGALACACCSGGGVVTLVPAAMQPSGPHTRESGGAVAFWGNGRLQSELRVGSGAVTINITARGTNAGGEWPKVRVLLATRVIGILTIDSRTLADYTLKVDTTGPGASILEVQFVNYAGVSGRPLAGRNLLVQKITVRHA